MSFELELGKFLPNTRFVLLFAPLKHIIINRKQREENEKHFKLLRLDVYEWLISVKISVLLT